MGAAGWEEGGSEAQNSWSNLRKAIKYSSDSFKPNDCVLEDNCGRNTAYQHN